MLREHIAYTSGEEIPTPERAKQRLVEPMLMNFLLRRVLFRTPPSNNIRQFLAGKKEGAIRRKKLSIESF